jgi:hypothetical protein
MKNQLTLIENKALKIALSGNVPWFIQLRQQIAHLSVTSREYTGVGFYTDFMCEGCVAAERLSSDDSETVPVAWASHPDIENGTEGAICFNVFIKNGMIVCLEGASGAAWPETEELITFSSPTIDIK